MTFTGNNSRRPAEDISQAVLLQRITSHIRQSLELPEILEATVEEVRQLLNTDRVMIYRFSSTGSGEVVAESIADNRLPSLKGLNFPADDIPQEARQLYIELGLRSIVDVTSGKIGLSPYQDLAAGNPLAQTQLEYRQVDSCHLEYLKAMGVKASVVVPLLYHDLTSQTRIKQLWGLLISHHSEQKEINETELESLQWVADQVMIAIAQSSLLASTRQQAQREATINRVSSLLHSLPTVEVQQALEEVTTALKASSGRLYIKPYLVDQSAEFYECGLQLDPVEGHLLEEHPVWEEFIKSGGIEQQNQNPIPIVDLYQTPVLRVITPAFAHTPIRGLLIVPLYYHQQFLGSLTIFRNEIETETLWAGQFDPSEKQTLPRQSFEAWRELKKGQSPEWTIEDIALAKALGNHFAMAIEQYELYQQVNSLNSNLECQVEERTAKLKRSLELQNALKRTTDQIRSTLELETTLNTLVCDVRELLNADRVVIYRFLEGGNSEALVETVGKDWNSALNISRPKNSLTNQENETLIIEDISKSEIDPTLRAFLNRLEIKAKITVPIGTDSQAWGLLSAQVCQCPRIWQNEEIELLQQLADQAAVAIQQAELYQRIRSTATMATKRAKQLERSAKQQKTLFQVITKIRESLDLNTIFQTATTALRQLLDADRVAVFQFHAESYNQGEFISEDVQAPFASVLLEKVEDYCFGEQFAPQYQQGKIHAIADIDQAPIQDCHRQILKNFQVKANLIVPLLQGDQLWGLLCIHYCQSPREWENSEIKFVEQIAAHLGVAIQQGSLFAQTQQQKEDIAQALKDLQQAQTQLIQTEKMSSLGQLVAGVAHEINNPVNFIYGNLNHLGQYTEDLLELLHTYGDAYPNPTDEILDLVEDIDLEFLEEDLPKVLTSLKVGAERIRQLVMSLRNFSHHDQAERKPVDIHEGIDSTLLILQHRLKARSNQPEIQVIKEYDQLPLIECYAGQMNQVYMNIISNAIDALEEGDDPEAARKDAHIRIRTRLAQDSVVIAIADNGPGMPESVLNSIFDPFFTTKPIGKGTGLGMAISYQIVVEKHGGTLRCTSEAGKGTEFEIEIPVREQG